MRGSFLFPLLALFLSIATAAQAVVTVPEISVISMGAYADGSHYDSTAIQAAVDHLPAGGGIVDMPTGTYKLNNTINIGKSVVFKGFGQGNTTITRGAAVVMLNFTGSTTKASLKDLTLDGAALEAGNVNAQGIDTLTVEDITCKRAGVPGYPTHQGAIDGIRASGVTRLFARGSLFDSCERDGICGIPVKYLTVQGCNAINNGRLGFVSDHDPTLGDPVSTIYQGCNVENCGSGGLHMEATSSAAHAKLLAVGNRVKTCGNSDWGYSWGIVAGGWCGGTIAGNVVEDFAASGTATGYGSALVAGGGDSPVEITGNSVYNARNIGVQVNANASLVSIHGNNVSGCNVGCDVYNTPGVLIQGNTFTNSQQYGVKIRLAPRAQLLGNVITNSSLAGANLYSGFESQLSSNVTVIGNEINGSNQLYGINLDSTGYLHGWQVRSNLITSFGTGWFDLGAGSTSGEVYGGLCHFQGTAVPTTGTWIVGDTWDNTAPAANAPTRWSVTTAGTPGTWSATAYAAGAVQSVTTATATVAATSSEVEVNRAGAVALTFPGSTYTGRGFRTKDVSGGCSPTNVITFTPGSGTTIESTYTLDSPFAAWDWYLDGTVWRTR